MRRALGGAALSAVAVATGLAIGGVIIAMTGGDVVAALSAMLRGSVGSPEAVFESLRQTAPLLLVGLGVAFAMRAGLFNLGGEGQIYIGALFAVIVGLSVPWVGPIPLLVVGALAGAVWGGAAGVMRTRLDMNEVITTLLMNFIAFWLVSWAVHGPLRDKAGGGYPWTPALDLGSHLEPIVVGSIVIPMGFVIGLLMAAVMAVVLGRTVFGFEIRMLGASPRAAAFAGIDSGRRTFQALAISGGLAGLAGAVELTASQYRLSDFFSPGYGFTAIAVALVGNSTPMGTVAAALLFGAMRAGAASMERTAGVPASISLVIQGTIIGILVAARSPVGAAIRARLAQRALAPVGQE